jgi:hypothetical protein
MGPGTTKQETPEEREQSEQAYRAWLKQEEKHSELLTPNAADIEDGDEEEEDE